MNKKVYLLDAQSLGKKGGKKTKEKYGKNYYSEIGKKGAEKRWKKTAK